MIPKIWGWLSTRLWKRWGRGNNQPLIGQRSSPFKKVAKVIIDPAEETKKKIDKEEEELTQKLRALRQEQKKLTQKKKSFLDEKKKWKVETERIVQEIKDVKNKLPVKLIRVSQENTPKKHPVILEKTETFKKEIVLDLGVFSQIIT